MKKVLLSVLMAGVMSTGAMALYVDGTVVGVNVSPDKVIISVKRSSDGVIYHRQLDSSVTGDYEKAVMATVLTAYSTGAHVIGIGPGGNWNSFRLVNY